MTANELLHVHSPTGRADHIFHMHVDGCSEGIFSTQKRGTAWSRKYPHFAPYHYLNVYISYACRWVLGGYFLDTKAEYRMVSKIPSLRPLSLSECVYFVGANKMPKALFVRRPQGGK